MWHGTSRCMWHDTFKSHINGSMYVTWHIEMYVTRHIQITYKWVNVRDMAHRDVCDTTHSNHIWMGQCTWHGTLRCMWHDAFKSHMDGSMYVTHCDMAHSIGTKLLRRGHYDQQLWGRCVGARWGWRGCSGDVSGHWPFRHHRRAQVKLRVDSFTNTYVSRTHIIRIRSGIVDLSVDSFTNTYVSRTHIICIRSGIVDLSVDRYTDTYVSRTHMIRISSRMLDIRPRMEYIYISHSDQPRTAGM